MERVKMAVVGAGLFGEYHARAYYEYHRSELVLVCDIDRKRAEEIGARYGCAWTTDIQQVLENPEIRGVSVATPDYAHRDPVVQLLQVGKHVLVEKPLATSTAEAREMVNLARKNGLKLMVDFHNRWSPVFVQARQTVLSERWGRPVMGYARLSNPLRVPMQMLSWSTRSGPQWFLLPHIVDLVRWLFAQEALEVHAVGCKGILEAKGIDAYDAIQATVFFEDSFATFETSWVLPDSYPSVIDFYMALYGTEGRIGIKPDYQGIEISGERHEWPFVLGQIDAHGHTIGFMQYPMMHFVDSIAEVREPLATGEDGFAVTAIIEAAERSIQEEKRIEVEKL
ncbi:MAG TPA: Gfo/Idh/MocA family oxidoreductase [Candidatus Latescibacteria bacterium]|nr:Gfo/Idh/MocA family oxidoreductase [Candidatus Latescibacterota bacterium]